MDFKLLVHKTTAEARWKESLDTEELIRNYLPDANDEKIEQYIKQIGKIWEVFEVSCKEHTWTYLSSQLGWPRAMTRSRNSSSNTI
jgi:hypothetical protein